MADASISNVVPLLAHMQADRGGAYENDEQLIEHLLNTRIELAQSDEYRGAFEVPGMASIIPFAQEHGLIAYDPGDITDDTPCSITIPSAFRLVAALARIEELAIKVHFNGSRELLVANETELLEWLHDYNYGADAAVAVSQTRVDKLWYIDSNELRDPQISFAVRDRDGDPDGTAANTIAHIMGMCGLQAISESETPWLHVSTSADHLIAQHDERAADQRALQQVQLAQLDNVTPASIMLDLQRSHDSNGFAR